MPSTALAQIHDHLVQLFKFGAEPVAILPAKFVQPAGRAARLWILARSLDHPCNGGSGAGLIRLSLVEVGRYLNRSERSIWRYIKEALAKGYLYRADVHEGIITIEYRGIRQLAEHLGLEKIGAVGKIALRGLEHAKAYAAQIQAKRTEADSFFSMRKEWGRFARGAKTADEILKNKPSSVREPGGGLVLARGHRLVYLAPYWRPFGASQEGIARELGVSLRTVQYRLDNRWNRSRNITLEKAQSAHQVFSEFPPGMFDALVEASDEPKRYTRLGRKLFRVGCNLYGDGEVLLKRIAYREEEYKTGILQNASFENRVPGNYRCITSEVSLVPVTEDSKFYSPENRP